MLKQSTSPQTFSLRRIHSLQTCMFPQTFLPHPSTTGLSSIHSRAFPDYKTPSNLATGSTTTVWRSPWNTTAISINSSSPTQQQSPRSTSLSLVSCKTAHLTVRVISTTRLLGTTRSETSFRATTQQQTYRRSTPLVSTGSCRLSTANRTVSNNTSIATGNSVTVFHLITTTTLPLATTTTITTTTIITITTTITCPRLMVIVVEKWGRVFHVSSSDEVAVVRTCALTVQKGSPSQEQSAPT